ncbi:MAG: hypothetical protein RIA63_11260 [Cyclobacteriaceae bacterium]
MKTHTPLATLLVLCCHSFAQAQDRQPIQGIWQNSEFGYQMTIILNTDGSGEFDGESIRYALQGNRLTMVIAGQPITYNYTVNGNTLSLSGGDLDNTIDFKKGGDQEVAEINEPPQPPSVQPASDDNKTLLGVWSGNGETIEFKSSGDCVYVGNTYTYQSVGNTVTLITSQGNVSFTYSVQGNQLTLSGNGNQAVYTKGNNTNNIATNNTKGVATELVGKWCWIDVTNTNSRGSQSSRCITLNADGTYVYESERSMSVNTNTYYGGTNSQSNDRGTWYLQGDRIFYDSQNTGQGSYRLEKRNHPKNVNDPMIVLDGEAYVTQTYRQPWR